MTGGLRMASPVQKAQWRKRREGFGASTAPWSSECNGDDVKMGKLTSFPQSVKLKPNETVVFSFA